MWCLSQRWKAESAQFREAMRNSRLIAQAEKEGKDLSTIDFGPSDPNAQPQVCSDPTTALRNCPSQRRRLTGVCGAQMEMCGCPTCGRNFSKEAAERHIPSCAQRKARGGR